MNHHFPKGTRFNSKAAFLQALRVWHATTDETELGFGRRSDGQNRNHWIKIDCDGVRVTVIAGTTRENVEACIEHGDNPWSLRPTKPYPGNPNGNPLSRKIWLGDKPTPMYARMPRKGRDFPLEI